MTKRAAMRRAGWHGLLAAAYGAALAVLPLLLDRAAYLRDDMETQFVPTLMAVGRTLWTVGQVPLLTLHSWAGGNLAGEFQYALFNPVILALYAVLPAFDSQAAAAAFLCVALAGVLTAGGFALARAFDLPAGLAHVAAAAIGGNAFLHYWFASSWFPGFSSTAFMVWAMAFVVTAHRGRGPFLGCVVAVYLVTTAGWPQAVIALGAFTLAWLIALQRGGFGWRRVLDTGIAALLGVLAGAIAVGPLLGVAEVARRSTEIGNAGLLVANLRDILSLSSPFHFAVMIFIDNKPLLVQAPVFHAAWFVLPLLALLDWRRLRWRDPVVVALTGFAALMLIATQGPSQLLWMRYPIKFLPYFQIAVVLLALRLLHDAGFAAPSPRRRAVLGLLLGVSTLSALQSAPAFLPLHLAFAAFCAVAMLTLQRERSPRAVAGVLFGATFGVAAMLRTTVPGPLLPEGGVFRPFGVPREAAGPPSLTTVPSSYDLVLAAPEPGAWPPEAFRELPFGQIGLQQARATLGGYSPIGHRGLSPLFCRDNSSRWACPDAVARLQRNDPGTGVPPADLFRIARVVVERDPSFEEAGASLVPPWKEVASSAHAVTYERPLPNAALPGSLAWPMVGLRAEAIGPASAEREALRLSDRDPVVTRLVFARAYWPGYAARLNGVPLPVRAHDGIFVAVDLPPGVRDGDLVLSFTPAGLQEGIAVSLAAILAALAHAAFLHGARPRRRI